MICAVYREHAVTDQMCQKWFVEFCAGDISWDNAPQLGRPVEDDGDQIDTLNESTQCYTTKETANILKMATSIKLLVKMKNVFYFTEKKTCGLLG